MGCVCTVRHSLKDRDLAVAVAARVGVRSRLVAAAMSKDMDTGVRCLVLLAGRR